jgi:hypothetical protein
LKEEKIKKKNKGKKSSPFLIVEKHHPFSSTANHPSSSRWLLHCQPTSTTPTTTSLSLATIVQPITVVTILTTNNAQVTITIDLN